METVAVAAETTFAARLVRLRQEAGLSQRGLGAELAEHGGEAVSGSAVGEWERGESNPGRTNVLALERRFGLVPGSLAEMVGYSAGDEDGLAALRAELAELKAAIGGSSANEDFDELDSATAILKRAVAAFPKDDPHDTEQFRAALLEVDRAVELLHGALRRLATQQGVDLPEQAYALAAEGASADEQKVTRRSRRPSPPPED